MLSNKAKYGLKALIYLARMAQTSPTTAVTIAEIAEQQAIPRKFLDLILLDLRNAGLLHSRKGRAGGYMLALSAEDIAVGRVVRLLDGPLAPIACASRTAYQPCTDCRSVAGCGIRGLMLDVRDAIANVMDNTTLASLVAREEAHDVSMYFI